MVDGYDLTVMAYGQAGTGKTHALFGPGPTDPTTSVAQLGLLPRFIRALFDTGPLRQALFLDTWGPLFGKLTHLLWYFSDEQ